MTHKEKFGNVILDDSQNTAERTLKTQDRNGTIADVQNVLDVGSGKSSYYCSGSPSYIKTAETSALAIGSSDCTILVSIMSTKDSDPETIAILRPDSGLASYLQLKISSSGGYYIEFVEYDGTASTATSEFVLDLNKQNSIAVTRYSSNKIKFYKNGIEGIEYTNTRRILSGNKNLQIGNAGTSTKVGIYQRLIMFNYALSAEQIAKYSAGAKLDYADIGGSMTPLNSATADQDFSSDTGYWTKEHANVTFTGGVVRFASVTTNSGLVRQNFAKYGKRIRITFTISNYSAGGIVLYGTSGNAEVFNANGTYTREVLVTSANTGSVGFVANGTTSLDLDNVTITQLGAVLDLEPESATSQIWYDESGNQLDGVVTAAELVNIPKYLNTDFGVLATKQEVQDTFFSTSSYKFIRGTTTQIASETSPSLALGTLDATILVTASSPNAVGSGTRALARIQDNATNAFQVYHSGATDYFNVDTVTTALKNPGSDSIFTLVAKRYTRSGNGYVKAYLNGISDIERSYTIANITTTLPLFWLGSTNAAATWDGNIYRSIVFNYALSDEKIRKYSSGAKLDYEDIGGSMSPINSATADQTFSSDTGWWSKDSFVTINASSDGKVKYSNGGTTPQNGNIYRNNALVVGKKYRLTFTLEAISGGGLLLNNTQCQVTYVSKDGVAQSLSQHATTTGVWIFEFIALQPNLSGPGIDTAGATATLDNLIVIQLGAIIDLEPENIADLAWIDSSPNGINCNVSGAIANKFSTQYSTKNYIINGGMDFWQRGTSFTGTAIYAADRFYKSYVGTLARDTDAPNNQFSYSLKYTKTANQYANIIHKIEAAEAKQLAGKRVTLSYWAKLSSGSVGSLNLILDRPGSDDNFGGTLTREFTVSLPTMTSTWTRYSYTFIVPANCKYGMQFEFYRINDSDATVFLMTGMMLNEGPVAAPFERAGGSIGGELLLAQRYCIGMAMDSSTQNFWGIGYGTSTTTADIFVIFPTRMRANPTLLALGSAGDYRLYNSADLIALSSLPVVAGGGASASRFNATITCTVSSGLTQHRPYSLIAMTGLVGQLIFSSEL